MKRKPMRSDIAWSAPDRITVKGRDLCTEILGRLSLGDMAFLELADRVPTSAESAVFNAIAVTLVEHGLTPSALATRLTYAGAPEAMQAAVAAGLCGLGSVFVGSMESAARMLQEALPQPDAEADLAPVASRIVAGFRQRNEMIGGIGHTLHKPVDPRAPRLFEIARENGFYGPYCRLMTLVAEQAQRAYGRSLPVNATGAIGAIACELGFPWRIVRGIGVLARAIGLVGHILEEMRAPLAYEMKSRTEDEATAHMRAAPAR
jgi:citrate synthase